LRADDSNKGNTPTNNMDTDGNGIKNPCRFGQQGQHSANTQITKNKHRKKKKPPPRQQATK
jgi:hypothetical protein